MDTFLKLLAVLVGLTTIVSAIAAMIKLIDSYIINPDEFEKNRMNKILEVLEGIGYILFVISVSGITLFWVFKVLI